MGLASMLTRALPPNVRPHGPGFQATVKYRGARVYLSFGPSATAADMREAIDAARADLVLDRGERPEAGTFAADAERYLRAVRSMASFQDRAKHIAEWVAVFGRRRRSTIKAAEMRANLEDLKVRHGYAGSSLNHRRSALMHLYTTLDGRGRRNPVRDVPKYPEREAEPRALPREVVVLLLRAIKPGTTRGWLHAIRWTGLPPAQLLKVTRADLNYESAEVRVTRRRKGRGVEGRTLPLLPQAVRAFRYLERLGALGRGYNDRAMRETIRRARRRILARAARRVGKRSQYRISERARWWLSRDVKHERIRPYDFRHTFGTMLRFHVPDARARQELMLHSDPRQTARYEKAAADPMVRAALGQLATGLNRQRRGGRL